MMSQEGQKVDLGVKWLGGYVHEGGMMVYDLLQAVSEYSVV